MNAKILLMVIAIFGTSLVFSQTVNPQTVNPQSKTNCNKEVLKKIKRNMNSIKVADYMEVDHKIHVVLTCKINENHIVEVVSAKGYDKKLNAAVIENLEADPVICKSESTGDEFQFILTFKHLSL